MMTGMTYQANTAAMPELRSWLAQRSSSERETLSRLWKLPDGALQSADLQADALLKPATLNQLLMALGPRERAALQFVQQRGGSVPTAVLEREFGVIRTHARYPNQRAYLLALEQPPSPAERLYMLAFLLPVRFSRWADAQPDAYAIPTDLLQLLPPTPERDRTLRVAPADEPEHAYQSSYMLIERFVLILLALAQDELLEVIPSGGLNKASLVRIAKWRDPKDQVKGAWREEHWPFVGLVRHVAEGAGLLRAGADAKLRPTREALVWMRQPIQERARQLLEGWGASRWDELVSFLGMKLQRAYDRDLGGTKRATLDFFRQIPPGQWVDFDAFAAAVKQVEPDFARPDGRYDSWGLSNYARQPIDGFEFWDDVEGQQLKSVAGTTLYWLGVTDLGMQGDKAISFRVNDLGAQALGMASSTRAALPETELPVVQPNFEVIVPAFASPYARFQLGRIAARTPDKGDVEIYTLTKKSIQAALERGISHEDILRFLREETGREPPQNVAATLREWAGQHGQVTLRRGVLLETEDAALLEQIRRDRRVKLPAVEQINDRAWLLREADAQPLAERLRKAGYGLAGDGGEIESPLKENDMAVLFAALDFYDVACEQLRIQSDVSDALRRRVMRLLAEKQINRAYQASRDVLRALEERLAQRG